MNFSNELEQEAWIVNNPALGGYLLWTFCIEHYKKTQEEIHPARLFLVLPFVFHLDTRSILFSTSSSRNNLTGYLRKFSSSKQCASDIPLSIHYRVKTHRERTLESLLVAIDCGLLIINPDNGCIKPNHTQEPISKENISYSEIELVDCSSKLGNWFSDYSMDDLSRTLKVNF